MLLKKNEKKRITLTVAVIVTVMVCMGLFYFLTGQHAGTGTDKSQDSAEITGKLKTSGSKPNQSGDIVVEKTIEVKPEIDYHALKNDENLKALMQSRKKKLGLKNSLDMIVRSDETFTIGDQQIAMKDILKQAFIKQGDVFQEKIESSGEIKPKKIREFGIYVVKPGDNIWNIHFNILKEYYESRGIQVAPKADEPVGKGLSSGVGKILKFSETMVIIYNLVERRVDENIDLLQPLSKIVVYNMDEVFSLLQEINYENIDRIQFDGETIWIPTEKN